MNRSAGFVAAVAVIAGSFAIGRLTAQDEVNGSSALSLVSSEPASDTTFEATGEAPEVKVASSEEGPGDFVETFEATGDAPEVKVASSEEGPGDFVETFDGNTGLERFDYGLWHRDDDVLRTRQWTGDHDENCGSPATQRTIRREAWQDSFYMCRDHMMTSVGDTSGYSVGWFAPNQTFSDKRTVSWDVNMTNLGARQWWEVMIVPAGDDSYFRPKRVADGTDCLVCATRDGMAQTAGLPTYGPGSIAVGSGPWGVNIHLGGEEQYSGWQGTCGADWGLLIDHPDDPCNSKPPRLTSSITDNGNGTITVDYAGVWTETFSGSFPDEFEVVFKDHNYTPDKDGIPAGHTWHWDHIIIN